MNLTSPAAVPSWLHIDPSSIHDPGVDMVIAAPQMPVPPIADVASLALGRIEAVWSRKALADSTASATIARAIAPLGLRSPELSTWMLEAVERFAAATDVASVTGRVEITDEITCPKFHVDMVHVRLVTTLHGAGTEFIHRDEPARIHRARMGDLVLLKGRRHPTHTDTVHHRSPALPYRERRVVMVLDG